MSPDDLTVPLAFLAGLLSFLSPCVLPLVPAYLGYLGGTAALTAGHRDGARRTSRGPFLHALFFVLGFALVFVLLGASATLLGRVLFDFRLTLARVGGVLLVVFGVQLMATRWRRGRWITAAAVAALLTFGFASGLFIQGRVESAQSALRWLTESAMMGLVVLAGADLAHGLRWPQIILGTVAGILNFLASPDDLLPTLVTCLLIAVVAILVNRPGVIFSEKRLELGKTGQAGLARSFLFGIVFAAGWTPCIGPILAAILVVASQLQTVGQGVLLLGAYSLGLGIPFLLVGLAFGPLSGALRRVNRYLGLVSAISGLLLTLMGILIFADSLSFLARYGNLIDLGF